MAKADGGELIARVMRENRVKYCFAINGGHLFPILAQLRNHDIKLIHMRHEQATAYAADAYARVSGEPGVCMVTAGCGPTNPGPGPFVAGGTHTAAGLRFRPPTHTRAPPWPFSANPPPASPSPL